VTFLENTDQNHIPASSLIELVIPCLSEELFTLKKNYTVVKEVPYAVGKWPESLGNSFFIDSEWLVPDFIDMAKQKLEDVLLDHELDGANAIEIYEELTSLLMKKFERINQNDYAFVVLGKMHDREETYLYGMHDVLIHTYNNFLFHFRNDVLAVRSPMFHSVEKFEYVNFYLGSIFFTIIFFLFLIDGILIYSLMLNDVEERTYEFAMLRCLGFKNSSLVTLLLV
jgi:ABC-type antimicrobial peptide transport system permease subunit